MEPSRGKLFAERYQILDDQKDGPVYLAEDRGNSIGSLQVLVNLRILDRKLYNLYQLEDKVRLLRQIKNDNLVKVFDLVKGPELLAVSTERFNGTKLEVKMRSNVFSSYEIVTCLLQIAKAIEALHDAGIVHGGISEEHIYVCEDSLYKLDPLVPNPLIPNDKNHFESTVDIAALAEIGHKLASASLYCPKGILINKDGRFWTKIIEQHPKLLSLLNSMKSGKGGIRFFRSELEKLLYDGELTGARTAKGITYCFSANITFAIFTALSLMTVAFFTLITFLPFYSATFTKFIHLIDAVLKF